MTQTGLPSLLIARGSSFGLPRLDRDRSLLRLRSGVYVRRSDWDPLPPWDRYRLRVLAVEEAWKEPVFCLESAAVLQGLPVFGEPRDIHLLDVGGTTWRERDVVVHGSPDERRIVRVDGHVMTSPEDTAVDLGRVLPPAFALAVADAAARRLAASFLLRVADVGRAQANRRGLRTLDWVQERTSADAESPGESVSRAVIEWLGYAPPELQVTFSYEGHDDRVDFFWRRSRVIGESDGYGKYDAADVQAAKQHFVREKRREDRLRRYEAGFARWDWKDAVGWRSLDRILAAAGLVPVQRRDAAMLATLARHPRSLPPTPRDRGSRPTRGATPPVSA